jgi:hypothetical protein
MNISDKLLISCTNADSLANKREDVKIMLKGLEHIPHVIIIMEVKTKNNLHEKLSEFNIDGYELLGNDLDVNDRGIYIYR